MVAEGRIELTEFLAYETSDLTTCLLRNKNLTGYFLVFFSIKNLIFAERILKLVPRERIELPNPAYKAGVFPL